MKTGLVLEGGGMRGIYTNGVLDCLMDNGFSGCRRVRAAGFRMCRDNADAVSGSTSAISMINGIWGWKA